MNDPSSPSAEAARWREGPPLLQSMWRRRWLLVATMIVAVLAGYGLSLLQPVMYGASGRIFLGDPTDTDVFTENRRFDLPIHTAIEAERLTSVPVLTRASELLPEEPPVSAIRGQVTVETDPDLGVITLGATSGDAAYAADVVNAVAGAYQQLVAERRQDRAGAAIQQLADSRAELEAGLADIRAGLVENPDDLALAAQVDAIILELGALGTRAEELEVDAALYGSGVDLYEEARTPGKPAQPKPVRTAALTGVVGLVAAGAFAWWHAGRNQTADSRDDPGRVLDVPLLGSIPSHRQASARVSSSWILSDAGPAAAEAYQFVAASIDFLLEDIGGSTALITSPTPGEGKTVTTLNVATAANREDRSVAVVDGDTRARRLSMLTNATHHKGLSDIAYADAQLEDCIMRLPVRLSPVSQPRPLALIPAGTNLQDPAGFFRTGAFRKSLVRTKEVGDLVLIDSPPLLTVADSLAIAAQVDAVVLVVDCGTPLSRLSEVRQRLEFIGAPLVGYVFNRDPSGSGAGGYGGMYGYGAASQKGRRFPGLLKRRGGVHIGDGHNPPSVTSRERAEPSSEAKTGAAAQSAPTQRPSKAS